MEKDGIIYMITNNVNGKIYIGQTKKMYGSTPFGINGRFKIHLRDALANKTGRGCPALCAAIRKHGKENFSIKKLFDCELNERDNLETALVKKYDTQNKDKGYNIAAGGKGRSVVHVGEEARKKISMKQKDGEMNIEPIMKNKKLVGYRVKRREKGTLYEKWFTSAKFSVEENLKSSRIWLENFKNNIPNESTKASKLPKNISYLKKRNDKNITVGYRVNILKNGVRFDKSFQDGSDMNLKLEKAIKYKNSILNTE